MKPTQPFQQSARRSEAAWGTLLAVVLTVMLTGCDNAPTTLEGAWLGEGKFHTRAGDAEVQAQLELLSNGSYRFLILKPAILTLTGMEEGAWSRTDRTLTLTPAAAPPPTADTPAANATGGVFQQLRAGSAAAEKPPRTLTIADDLRDLRLNDGKLELTFTPNREATASLRAAGEVTDP